MASWLNFKIALFKNLLFSSESQHRTLELASTMSTRVYVGGLSYRARERDVERYFRKFGKIKDVSMKNGFCFIEFEDYRDADDACYELNGKSFHGDR